MWLYFLSLFLVNSLSFFMSFRISYMLAWGITEVTMIVELRFWYRLRYLFLRYTIISISKHFVFITVFFKFAVLRFSPMSSETKMTNLRFSISHVNFTVKPTKVLLSRFLLELSQLITLLLDTMQMLDVTHVSCCVADSILVVILFLIPELSNVPHPSKS